MRHAATSAAFLAGAGVASLLLLAACGSGAEVASQAIASDPAAAPIGRTWSWRDPVPAPPPPANMPPPGSPQFFSAAAQEFAWSQGRGEDQQVNLDYVAKTAPLIPDFFVKSQGGQVSIDHPILHDPFIADWGRTRGDILDVVVLNRYGAKLKARMYSPKLPFTDPVTGARSNGPFPALVFIPGYNGYFETSPDLHDGPYESGLEQIAAHGYVVIAVSPQGQGGSETFSPPSPWCDPNGWWKQPQEMGLRELGECAGQDGLSPPAFAGPRAGVYNALEMIPVAGDATALLAQAHSDPKNSLDVAAFYEGFRTRFVFAALDTATWLASSQNPWRARTDVERLGAIGHSAGSDAAIVAANGDPQHRFKAAVSWDEHGLPPEAVSPTVPTMLIKTELQPFFGPYDSPPHDEYFASYRIAQRFMAEHVDSMMLTLRGSNHEEFDYIPYTLLEPFGLGPLSGVSSRGGLVSRYYTIAWLDRWLKGASTSQLRGDEAAQIADARTRLLARSFDDSADRTSIGQGTYSPLTRRNEPYRIAGERVADHLTFFLHSQFSIDGMTCLDWQAGC